MSANHYPAEQAPNPALPRWLSTHPAGEFFLGLTTTDAVQRGLKKRTMRFITDQEAESLIWNGGLTEGERAYMNPIPVGRLFSSLNFRFAFGDGPYQSRSGIGMYMMHEWVQRLALLAYSLENAESMKGVRHLFEAGQKQSLTYHQHAGQVGDAYQLARELVAVGDIHVMRDREINSDFLLG